MYSMANREEFFGRQERGSDRNPDLMHLALCMLVTGFFILILSTHLLERFERMALDTFIRQRPPVSAHPQILIIEIEKESLQAIGPWPWPWKYHAEMIRILKKNGAKAVILDFALRKTLIDEEKQEMVEVLSAPGAPVYLTVPLETKTNRKIWVHGLPVDLEPAGEKTTWVHAPLEIQTKAAVMGHGQIYPDGDGVVRKAPAFIEHDQKTYPYLPLAVGYYLVNSGLRMTPGVSNLPFPLDEKNRFLINWHGPWKKVFARFSFAELVRSAQATEKNLRATLDLNQIEGKICLIGLTDSEIASSFVTPVESARPSVAVQADVLSAVLRDRYLIQASFLINAFYLSLAGFLASLLFSFFRSAGAFFAGLGLAVFWVIIAFVLFWNQSLWVYSVHAFLLTITLFIFSAIYTTVAGARERSKLFDLATRDGLTGLFVIRHFREILNREVTLAQLKKHSLAIILLDIDNFKKINDTYGHPAGDMVLKKTAETVVACCRTKRPLHKVDFVARYGGEELIIMLRAKLSDAALKAAERIRLAVEKNNYEWDGQKIAVTISLGVAALHAGENLPDLMVRRADEALYRAKKSGKNKTCIETFAAGASGIS